MSHFTARRRSLQRFSVVLWCVAEVKSHSAVRLLEALPDPSSGSLRLRQIQCNATAVH